MPVLLKDGLTHREFNALKRSSFDDPGPNAPLPEQTGERLLPHKGACARKHKAHLEILMDAEIVPTAGCDKCCVFATTCGCPDPERSYLVLWENRIETNTAITYPIWGGSKDVIEVTYFDRYPYADGDSCVVCLKTSRGRNCVCCSKEEPKVDVVDTGCWCCCCKHCSRTKVVVVPLEKYCCGFGSNRVDRDGCFGCYGSVKGNPILYSNFLPQPANPQEFARRCRLAMNDGQDGDDKPFLLPIAGVGGAPAEALCDEACAEAEVEVEVKRMDRT